MQCGDRSIPPDGLALDHCLEPAIARANALAAAHVRGVLHRELKPGRCDGDTGRLGQGARARLRVGGSEAQASPTQRSAPPVRVDEEEAGSRQTVVRTIPNVTTCPCGNGGEISMRVPPIHVPFLLPASSTVSVPPDTRTRPCRRETLAWCSVMSQSLSRPTV